MTKWRKYNGALIPNQPPHIEIDDNLSLIKHKVSDSNTFFARWVTRFDCTEETDFWYVICDKFFPIELLSRNTRNQIRRGLRNCKVELIDKEMVIQNGFDSYHAAFRRYNTHLKGKTLEEFKEDLINLSEEWEFWGVFCEGQMIGYSQNRIINDYCDYSTIKFHPEYLKLYSSYALFYTMNKYYLNEKGFNYVNDGARSISHQTNIQSFLMQKFKFRKAYCKLHIFYSPKIKRLLFIVYPFRLVIRYLRFGFFIKLNILIKQEEIRRSYEY